VNDKVNKSQFTNLYILKKAIFYLLPLAILISIILGIFFYKEITTKKNIIKIQAVNIINMQIARIGINFKHIVTDLIFFASYHQTIDALEDLINHDDQMMKLSEDISLFSRGSKIYDQIRILDLRGMEILRVNFSKGKPVIVSKDQLQFKGERYYFKDSFGLKRGGIFVSPFDLNIENGSIEKPLKPMIRFGTPIYNRKGQKQGVIIFNYLGANLIQDFKDAATNSPGFYMLLNSGGYWIIGRDSKDEWGFMYEDRKDRTMGSTFPAAWQKISSSKSGQFYSKEGLFTFTTFYPLLEGWKSSTGSGKAFAASEKTIETEEYCWKVVSYIPDSYFIRETNKSLGKYIYIGITIILVIGIMTWFLAQAVVRRRHAENELRERNQKLLELNELKNKFLGIAAHDLRNPIFSIRGFSEMLLAGDIGPVNEDQLEFLTMINTASQQMFDLVNDLLDVSVIESGKLTLRLTRGSLKDLLKERLKIMMIAGQKKEINLHTDLQDVSNFDFDRDRIAQVLDNLLSNAIKFSPTGSKVHITLSQTSNHAQIDVRDEGPGLSEEDQSKLFGTFQKLSAAPTGGEKSTGLGLSIVKKIIEAHRGSIEVKSQVGSGSTFSFRIPLEAKIE